MKSQNVYTAVFAAPKEVVRIVRFRYKYTDNISECENLSAKL
jgi:hypothetical protein